MNRRLSAILAADVVGYSALMEVDQGGTLAALRQLRSKVFGPVVAGHRGKVVKSMGDGWLVEFASAVDAVACAMQVQDRLVDHEIIKLRVGVHIGDVIQEDEDLFGDGVNVAARLEALASPGAVMISDAAFGCLDGTLRPSFDDYGDKTVKNIERPIRVWVRAAPGLAGGAGDRRHASQARGGFPRLTIRPVTTSDERAELRELADGLTFDIGAYLGAVPWLEAEVDVCRPPGGYELSAFLRTRGEQLRLETRVAGVNGDPIWAEKHDGDLVDAFEFQDLVSEAVAGQVLRLVLDVEKSKLSGKTIDEMTAEECNLAGALSVEAFDRDAFARALRYNAAAIEKGACRATVYADAIGWVLALHSMGISEVAGPYAQQYERWLAGARELVEESPALKVIVGISDYRQGGDASALHRAVREALRRAPFSVDVNDFGGWALLWSGDEIGALDSFRKVERLARFHPYFSGIHCGMGLAYVQTGEYEKAITMAERGLQVAENYSGLYRVLAAAHAHLGHTEKAMAASADALRLVPESSISNLRSGGRYADTPGARHYFEGLRLAGFPE